VFLSRKIKYGLFISLLCLQGIITRAGNQQDTAIAERRFEEAMKNTVREFNKKTRGDTTLQVIERLAKYDTLLKGELYDYYKFGLAHRKRAFEWNLVSSKITFWAVILLVFTGILFAGIQFYKAVKDKPRDIEKAPGDKTNGGKEEITPSKTYNTLNTELEASVKGIKVSSPVLGVIILVISLLFFYLYLAYVYPIQENF
jgi:hypothetical protein